MSMAPRVKDFLEKSAVPYQLIQHPYAETARSCAREARLPEHRLAKGVLLRDGYGYVLAVLPANRNVDLQAVQDCLCRPLGLADQQDVFSLFDDCVEGAVPPLARAYDLQVIWDEAIANEPACCLEAGDHQQLICVSRNSFVTLMGDGYRSRICC